jgi:hypothetical protein
MISYARLFLLTYGVSLVAMNTGGLTAPQSTLIHKEFGFNITVNGKEIAFPPSKIFLSEKVVSFTICQRPPIHVEACNTDSAADLVEQAVFIDDTLVRIIADALTKKIMITDREGNELKTFAFAP